MKITKKIIISIVVILLILWLIIFCTDFYKVSNNQEPIFAKPRDFLKDGGSYIAYGLGYKVIRYSNVSGTKRVYKIGFLNLEFDSEFSSKHHDQYDIYYPVQNTI